MIADRTMAAKKAQGATRGNRTKLSEAAAKGNEANRAAADAFAANVLPILRQIQAAGAATPRAVAAAWHDSTVRNLLARA